MAWYFGMEGGHALARVLFGDVNPSGKMPLTTPKDESQLPFFDEFADKIEYGPYHGYTLVDKQKQEPAFPFGYGLSYTKYSYANLKVRTSVVPADGTVEVAVDVTNTGARAGEEVVQLYVAFDGSSVDRPVKLLRGFKKVSLAPGETKTVAECPREGPGLVRCHDEILEGGRDEVRHLRRPVIAPVSPVVG